ncbi:uncharacterized protein EDB91DRAFT_1246584 [Suillus paluster]|uniref:uncharacterized protein n=1 Tax=Suillus paluster TaxID=48578 RepID=UPI001B85ED59|nr:uncharacterized protein EDB91DRAFT_1246584 [Suillus paluster]KAG1745075.1 hypothetical protein EDB91DRAFT_1246584 [Suillus paluster]
MFFTTAVLSKNFVSDRYLPQIHWSLTSASATIRINPPPRQLFVHEGHVGLSRCTFNNHHFSQLPHVIMPKLIAKGHFVMKFPVALLKAMISSRREVAELENLEKNEEELDSMDSEIFR